MKENTSAVGIVMMLLLLLSACSDVRGTDIDSNDVSTDLLDTASDGTSEDDTDSDTISEEGTDSETHGVASAELYKTQSYVYGRFEARVQFAPGDGVVSSFFLWKNGSEISGTYWNELDFEKIGDDCRLQTNPLYGNPVGDHSRVEEIADDLCAGYHDYSFEWTPDYIAWFVDGTEVRRETGAAADAFSENAASGMTFHFNIWPGDASFGGDFSPTILPVRQYISWVQYSSYVDESFEFEWREEFDGTSLPSGWSTGNWGSPKNYSVHNRANVGFVDGIAVLSLTADNATGFSDDPPVDEAASER